MTATPTSLDARVGELLRESAEWHLLARLFECPSAAWRDDLVRLSAELDQAAFAHVVSRACVEGTEGLFHSVFGPGGPAPPREVSYHDALELGTHLSALITLYAAFGYQPATVETPDHISVEVGFVAYLRLKEALALAGHDAESAAIARRASSRFVADHLAAMVEPLAGLLAASGVEYLAGASALLLARVGPKPKTTLLPVIRETEGDDEEGSAFGCGQ
jgi:nitrate reductase assembly molybdenum cofactor insertion protein NarJ